MFDKSIIEKTIVDLFREQVDRNLDAVCAVYGNKSLSYKEVDTLTDSFAKYLIDKGIRSGDTVAILVNSPLHKFLSSISVLKSGATYLPIVTEFPKKRIEYMMKDASTKFLIDDSVASIIFDLPKIERTEIIKYKPKSVDLFALIYTSGSTGNPKGVKLAHENVSAFCYEYRKYHEMDEKVHFAGYNSFTFVVHIEEYYTTITSGGSIYFMEDKIKRDVKAICDFYDKYKITNAHLPSSLAQLFINNMSPKTLKRLVVGGEAMKPCDPPKNYLIFNSYGPTECTIKVANFIVDKKYTNTPIGKASENIKLYIVGKDGKPVKDGEVGELCVAGRQVAYGYVNIIDEKVFTDNPFTDDPDYKRFYHTGDLARVLPDGNIECEGRIDFQVKIRGYRIETSEVEYAIREYKDIKDCVVIAKKDKNLNNHLVAYFVSDKEIDSEVIKDFLVEKLPRYMIPDFFMRLESIPYNVNGKVDRKNLPDVVIYSGGKGIENSFQRELYDAVKIIIDTDDFGIDTKLYDIGLDSIGTISLIIMLNRKYDIELSISDFSTDLTIEKLEAIINKKKNSDNDKIDFSIRERYPLNISQEYQFYMDNMVIQSLNLPHLYKLSEEVDLDRLEIAIRKVFDIHLGLKTIFKKDKKTGEIYVSRDDNRSVLIKREKFSELPDAKTLCPLYGEFDNNMYRISIFTASGEKYLFMDISHIITDGDSNGIIKKDISKAYNGIEIEPEKINAFDLSLIENKRRNGEEYEAAKKYYESIFKGCDIKFLPEPDVKDGGENYYLPISRNTNLSVEKIRDFCKKHKVSESIFFLAAFGYFFGENLGKDNSNFITVYHSRNSKEYENIVTMLCKISALRVNFNDDMNILDYLNEVKDRYLNLMIHDSYTYADLNKEYGVKNEVFFLFYGDRYEEAEQELCGYPALEIPVQFTPPTECTVVNKYKDGKAVIDWIYLANRYSKSIIDKMLNRYIEVLEKFLICDKIKDIKR